MITFGVILFISCMIVLGFSTITYSFDKRKQKTLRKPATVVEDIDYSFLTSDLDEALGNTLTDNGIITITNPAGKDIRLRGKKVAEKRFRVPDSSKDTVFSLYESNSGKYIFKYVDVSSKGDEVSWRTGGGSGAPKSHSVYETKGQLEANILNQLAERHEPYVLEFLKEIPEFEHLAYDVIE